jgi:hypothetical protein
MGSYDHIMYSTYSSHIVIAALFALNCSVICGGVTSISFPVFDFERYASFLLIWPLLFCQCVYNHSCRIQIVPLQRREYVVPQFSVREAASNLSHAASHDTPGPRFVPFFSDPNTSF